MPFFFEKPLITRKHNLLLMPKTLLYIIKPERYFEGVLKILAGLKGKTVIYITANKPYAYLAEFLKEKGIDSSNFFFIDCVTYHILNKTENEPPNCIFVKSPQNLTEISVAINECIEATSGEKVLLIDSLSTLLFYNDQDTIGKFSHFFISKMQLSGLGSIVLALESDMGKDIIQRIEALSEEVIKL